MTRRDTIIVAALVNAGLLIVMFVSALKDQGEQGTALTQQKPLDLMTNEKVAFTESKKIMGDEVDQVLKQYAQQDPLQAPVAIIPVNYPSDTPVELMTTTSQEIRNADWIEVKVKKGDVLERLARQNHSSVSDIMKLNNLSSTQLKIGQVLKITTSSSQTAPASKIEAVIPETASQFYTVKTGDSPWTIAVKNHMKVEELLKLNSMNEDKARRLKPGDQIRIR